MILSGIDTVIAKLNQVDFQGISDQIKTTARSADNSLAVLDRVADKVSLLDFQGISDQIKTTARSADNFLAGNRMNRIMSNLESSSTAFEKSMKQLDKIIAEVSLEGTLTEAKQSLVDFRFLIASTQEKIEALKLTDIVVKTNQVMDSLARSTWESAGNIQEATEKLRSASENLALLIERLEANPSDLLFSR